MNNFITQYFLLGFFTVSPLLYAQTEIQPQVLQLGDAVAIALEQNPDVAEANSRLMEAEAVSGSARAMRLPIVRIKGSMDYWTEDQRLAPATRNGDIGVFGDGILTAEIMASMPIYTGGRLSGELARADWNRLIAENQLTRTREILVFQITSVFYSLLSQQKVLFSLETAVRAMEEQQRVVQALLDAGKAAKVDLLRVNVRRAELYERQIREKNYRVIQQRSWAALLGLDDNNAPEAHGDLAQPEYQDCPDATVCMEKALSGRSDYQAAYAAISSAEAAVAIAKSGYKPTLSAQAAYGSRWMPDPADQSGDVDRWQSVGRIGLVIDVPLFDGFLTSKRVAEQEARKRGVQARLRKLELQIRFEVESALSDMIAARERVLTSDEILDQAAESFRIMKEKYDLGKGTLTDVLDAQTALVTAETNQSRALADLAVSDARRKLAVGDILP